MSYAVQKKNGVENNRLYEEDLSIHDWYRFVLSYPPHLVRNYIENFNLSEIDTILDPFSGTGTTIVEAKKHGIASFGIEANPVVHMCASTKANWSIFDRKKMLLEAEKIADSTRKNILSFGNNIRELPEDQHKLLIKNSINPLPLHKSILLFEEIDKGSTEYKEFFKTALCKHSVFSYSNLKFGPEIGVSRKKIIDVDVVDIWIKQIYEMVNDLEIHQDNINTHSYIHYGDARNDLCLLADDSISSVITSPPYPNEKDYSRTTRLELVLMNFIHNRKDLQTIKKQLLRSNTKGIYKGDSDNSWIMHNDTVSELANLIEDTRIRLNKDSGFEKLYHEVVRQYFGGMAKHLYDLQPKLKNGAKLAYVVGDQASYFRIPIRTGNILANIAENLGYKVVNIDLFRTRLSTVTKDQLNEEVVILEYMK